MQDFLGNAAHEKVLDPGQPLPAQDNQVIAAAVGLGDDVPGNTLLSRNGPDLNTVLGKPLLDQCLPGLFLGLADQFLFLRTARRSSTFEET